MAKKCNPSEYDYPNGENRYGDTLTRLRAWREYKYRDPKRDPALPPNWFGRISEDTISEAMPEHDRPYKQYNYGEGLGGKTRQPFRVVSFKGDDGPGVYSSDDDGVCDHCRGVVFRLPARDGRELFLAGCEWGEYSREGFDIGGGWIPLGPGGVVHESLSDAVRAADLLASDAADAVRVEREEEEEEQDKRRIERKADRAKALEDVLRLATMACAEFKLPKGCLVEIYILGELRIALDKYNTLNTADTDE